jgi:hypothetical protein
MVSTQQSIKAQLALVDYEWHTVKELSYAKQKDIEISLMPRREKPKMAQNLEKEKKTVFLMMID